MRRRFAFGAFTAAIVGCNAILGIESGEFEPPPTPADEAGGGDAQPSNDASRDGSIADVVETSDADASRPTADASDASDASRDADGGCGNVATDPQNCGRCGHDCLGGLCQASVCQPFEVAVEAMNDVVDGIALDDTHVFYTNATTGEMRRVVRDGSVPAETVYDVGADVGLGNDIAVRGGFVYFIDASRQADAGVSRLVRCPTTGCVGAPETVLDGVDTPHSLALTDTGIVTSEAKIGGRVLRCAQLPCESAPEVVSGSEERPERLAALGSTVAWTTLSLGGITTVRAKVGAAEPFTAASVPGIFAVALAGDEVLYSASASIDAVKLASPTTKRNLAKPSNCDQLSLFGSELFYTDKLAGRVSSVPLVGGTTTAIAQNQAYPRSIVADAKAVYWLNTTGARVMGLAR